MRVLFLTWEFPPLIAGGLGMACYGMVKALLGRGLEVDLVIPSLAPVYFPLRRPADADQLPVAWLAKSPAKQRLWRQAKTVRERLEVLGISSFPESYLTAQFSYSRFIRQVRQAGSAAWQRVGPIVGEQLKGEEDLFRKVQEYTARATLLVDKLQFDLVHAHDWLTYPAGLVVQSLADKPLVAHIHATEFDRAGGPGDERVHQIEHTGMSGAQVVIAVSRYTAQMVIGRYRIAAQKVRIVHNAHSMSPDDQARQRIFKGPLITFLGRVTLQKGPDYFLDLAQQVLQRHPRARFVMAGAGDMRRRMIHKAAYYRLKQHFLFASFLNPGDVRRLLRATDIFIMPSVSEPFGIVPLEAMAFGAAVIISKQSGVAEVVQNALKVDFWDLAQMTAMVCGLIDEPQRRLRLADAGRQEALAMKWEEAAGKIEKIYQELATC